MKNYLAANEVQKIAERELQLKKTSKTAAIVAVLLQKLYSSRVIHLFRICKSRKEKIANSKELLDKINATNKMMEWSLNFQAIKCNQHLKKMVDYSRYLKRLEEIERAKSHKNPWFTRMIHQIRSTSKIND
jgi:hypothetical protein